MKFVVKLTVFFSVFHVIRQPPAFLIAYSTDSHAASLFFSLQDCHIMTHSQSGEPVPDLQQDYTLLSSQENQTHTILRFRRRLNTCDEKFDVPITVSL